MSGPNKAPTRRALSPQAHVSFADPADATRQRTRVSASDSVPANALTAHVPNIQLGGPKRRQPSDSPTPRQTDGAAPVTPPSSAPASAGGTSAVSPAPFLQRGSRRMAPPPTPTPAADQASVHSSGAAAASAAAAAAAPSSPAAAAPVVIEVLAPEEPQPHPRPRTAGKENERPPPQRQPRRQPPASLRAPTARTPSPSASPCVSYGGSVTSSAEPAPRRPLSRSPTVDAGVAATHSYSDDSQPRQSQHPPSSGSSSTARSATVAAPADGLRSVDGVFTPVETSARVEPSGERSDSAAATETRRWSNDAPPVRPSGTVASNEEWAAATVAAANVADDEDEPLPPRTARTPSAGVGAVSQDSYPQPISDFYRHHYYYYPDDESAGTAAAVVAPPGPSAPSVQPSGSASSSRTSMSSSGDDVVELDESLHTPPPPSSPFIGVDEVPFVPGGLPPSPYVQRLAQTTSSAAAAVAHDRPSSSDGESGRRSRRGTGGSGPVVDERARSRARSVTPSQGSDEWAADGNGEDEADAAEREELVRQLAEKRTRLAQLQTALAAYSTVIDYRLGENATLRQAARDVQQQLENLSARTADAKAMTREWESKSRSAQELAVLRNMLAERAQVLETMEAKKESLEELLSQLTLLHEEARAEQASEEQRQRAARKEQRQQQEEGDLFRQHRTGPAASDNGSTAPAPAVTEVKTVVVCRPPLARRGPSALPPAGPGARPTECDASTADEEDSGSTAGSDDPSAQYGGEGTEPEPEPSLCVPQRYQRGASACSAPSLSCGRAPSMISAGTADVLQNFLSDLLAEMEALAKICIQLPSPPAAASHCSRANRSGASAWARDVNVGNNGFFSFFGGATESHLSAKPLSTFLSCASRLERAAWRMETGVQLLARELATDEEEEALRQRLAAAVQTSLLDDDDEESTAASASFVTVSEGSDFATPERPPHGTSPPMRSPELTLSAAARRRQEAAHSPHSPAPARAALQVALPSMAYAAPRLPVLSQRYDDEQIALQKAYEREVESQRTQRRQLVKALRERYSQQVEAPLRARLARAQSRQLVLAQTLVGLGVAEVTLQWEELDRDAADSTSAESGDGGARNAFAPSSSASSERSTGAGGSSAVQRTAKYLRQVVVRTLQAAECAPCVGGEENGRGARGAELAPMVSSTRRRLRSRGGSRSSTPHASVNSSLATPDRQRDVVLSFASSPLKTVAPISPSPLKGRPAASARGSNGSHASLGGGQSSARRHSTTRESRVSEDVAAATSTASARRPTWQSRASHRSSSSASRPSSAVHQDRASRAADVAAGAWLDDTRERLDRPSGRAGGSGLDRHGSGAGTASVFAAHPTDSVAMLHSGAVRVSLLFFGEEGRRRQREEAEKERHLKEFWALREELARVDESNFALCGRLAEAEERYKAQRCRQTVATQEAMEKLNSAKKYAAFLEEERAEWMEMLQELKAVQGSE